MNRSDAKRRWKLLNDDPSESERNENTEEKLDNEDPSKSERRRHTAEMAQNEDPSLSDRRKSRAETTVNEDRMSFGWSFALGREDGH